MKTFLVSHLLFLIHFHVCSNAAGEPQGATTFLLINKCRFTVWPGILSNAGRTPLSTTGFELPAGASRSVQAQAGWSGRFWGRTGCLFDASGHGFCATGDCAAGKVECGGRGAVPPSTLAEFSLGSGGGLDFYDVSLVDGYNLPMVVEGGRGRCAATGCVADLNRWCPADLRVGEGEAAAGCRSACDAFGRPEFCCSGEFASPATCRPTAYSELFKAACPKSYSYAFDDSSSTFTCAAAGEYTLTFCPKTALSQNSSTNLPPPASVKTPEGLMLVNDPWLASLSIESVAARKLAATSLLFLPVTVFSLTSLLSSPLKCLPL